MSELPGRELTCDSLFKGRLTCCQHRTGYRFSVDAVLLAHFFNPAPTENILDLGTGCGVIPLILAYRRTELRLTGLELQPGLAGLARRNVEANGYAERIVIREGDLREIKEIFQPGEFQRVLCNPPYHKLEAGRQNLESEQAAARHELNADIEAVARATGWLLHKGGKADLVYPAERLATLLTSLRRHDLEPKRLQMVHSYPGGLGKLALVEAQKGSGEELDVLPPFFIYRESGGEYSPEMARCYAP
jgi:tRNA1Val (adenine37-N6)-methyltransferase